MLIFANFLMTILTLGSDGSGTTQKTTLFYDPTSDTFETGQNTLFDRTEAGCALFTSPLHGDRPIVLIVGGKGQYTAEILDYTITDTWEQSKFPHL